MNVLSQQSAQDAAPIAPGRHLRPRRRRRAIITTAVVVLVIAAGGGGYYAVRKLHGDAPAPAADPYPTKLVPVTRRSLSEQTTVDGTLGYSRNYIVVVPSDSSGSSPPSSGPESGGSPGGGPSGSAPSGGTFTWLPGSGRVVRQGQRLYSVSNSPVVLLYGSVPVYRGLSQGMTGPDVRQLNRDLVALGDASKADLDPAPDYFSGQTAAALENLQSKLGLPLTGTLPVGQAVFEPSAVRVAKVMATLGAVVNPGLPVLAATSDARQAVAQVNPASLSEVSVGDRVTITLPNEATTTGVVTSMGTTAGGSPSPSGSGSSAPQATVNVYIRLDHPAATGNLDQAPITVDITARTVHNVLAVPTDALVAEPSGYGVEVAGPNGARRIVPVSPGLFDDAAGLVQVTGAGLAAGQQVVVPNL